MKLIITTQVQENYGAHTWDGKGDCPQHWKFKGGNDYVFNLGPLGRSPDALSELVMLFKQQIEHDNVGYREHIIAFDQVNDNFLTDFEQSQLDYDGHIAYPATEIKLNYII